MTYYIVWSAVGLVIIWLIRQQHKFWMTDPKLERMIAEASRAKKDPHEIVQMLKDEYEDCQYQRYLNEANEEIERLLA